MRDYKFSYFFDKVKGVKCTVPTKEVSLADLYNLVKTNESIRKLTETYRETGDKSIKEKLPFFTPSGLFLKKSDAKFLEHTSETYNWVIPFDIDKKDNPHIENWEDLFVNKIQSDPHVLIAFTSPSGGIKGLVCGEEEDWVWKKGAKISLHAKVMKEQFYPQIEKNWGVKLDPAQATLSQSMFISHDPYACCNQEATPMKPHVPVSAKAIIANIDDVNLVNDFFALEDFLKILETTKENKWQKLSGVFYFVGRVTAGRVISSPSEEILKTLLKAFHANPYLEDRQLGEKKMMRSWEKGLQEPIPIEQFLSKKALKNLQAMVKTYMLNEDLDTFMRIGDDYFQITEKIEDSGIVVEQLKAMTRTSFFDDHGRDAHHQIKKFYGFCNSPNYFGKSKEKDGYYNLWPILPYTPAPGLVDTSLYMISHICDGDQRLQDILLDILYLAMFKPEQLLPILALVSKSQGTGKTTFLEWLEKMFYGNGVIMESSKFEDQFNMTYATKHLIMIDEGEYRNDKKGIANKMKKWATQKTVLVNEKFMKSAVIDYYGRIIIASNQEDSFIKIEDDDVRYFVLKVPTFPKNKKSAGFVQDLFDEIPAFVHWLGERGLKKTKSEGERFWFSPEELETPWLRKIRKTTKDELTWTIMIKLRDWFADQASNKEEMQTTRTAFKEWLDLGHNVGLKYISQTFEKIGGEIDSTYTRGFDDLKPEKGNTTGNFIRIKKEVIDVFFESDVLQQESSKIKTAQKLL